MKKILLIDLDDTLLSFQKASNQALVNIFKMHNIPLSEENMKHYEEINQSYWERYERKEIDRDLILSRRFKDFFGEFGITTDGKNENEIYFKGLVEEVFYMDNAMDFLQKCKDLGMTILLASNGVNSVQIPRLKKSGIDKLLDGKYISELVGAAKPNIEFFNAIKKDYPNQEDQMVMLGDRISSDINGAKNANITTVWYNHRGEESDIPDYEIKNLMEFFSLDIMK
jgi:YjjG family noncanonical pyrimidine nucleotidase